MFGPNPTVCTNYMEEPKKAMGGNLWSDPRNVALAAAIAVAAVSSLIAIIVVLR